MPLLRHLFRKREDPYAGADLATAQRLGSALWMLGIVLSILFTPLAPPTAAIGNAGWLIWGVIIALGAVRARRIIKNPGHVTFTQMLVVSYAAIFTVATLEWLAGGNESPHHHLFLLSMILVAATHPPRRAMPFLGWVWLATAAPLVYDGADRGLVNDVVSELMVLTLLAFATLVLMDTVRAQRLASRAEGEEAKHLARVDAGTGLLNRRALEETLESEIAKAHESGKPLAVLALDLDDFKTVNDGWGHGVGDDCLRAVAAAIKAAVRGGDIAFRWAGDEFAVLLPGSAEKKALEVGDRIRGAVLDAVARPDGQPMTLSYGAAELREETDGAALLDAADRALLSAKARRSRSTTRFATS